MIETYERFDFLAETAEAVSYTHLILITAVIKNLESFAQILDGTAL